ncbi:WecB/TagA/CpsF family glycosyltransferase [Paracerasibacillus soli]|uniref:WecB/TagA/CpsF family glycosyltransferase n=1 Tax=Paracerasibacillus soli TaxID=480284 RepID=A0ABU5CSS6_9BACI|nr:WecB/TagA/CpsF family glycosyltransferase [Virgibacillus soli]MDY0409431.1 WecB/TagA/CpsF family glycosyltransferase [Virgibacillus soli]
MQNNHDVSIMDIKFINMTKQELLDQILIPRIEREEKTFIVTANPEFVMHARENKQFKETIQSADIIVPDGIGIIKAAKIKKQPLKERIAGYELMLDLLKYANMNGLACYFLGASKLVNEKVINVIKSKYPQINIVGHHHGFFDLHDPKIKEEVAEAKPGFVFVALGMMKQEQWISEQLPRHKKGVFIGIGGSFDTLTGEVKRAPQKWIDLNLEWLYRIIKQPFR